VPLGFQDTLVAGSLSQPATLAFSPDGRLFIGEKASGKIRIVENGTLLPTPFLDLTQLVPPGTALDNYSERGLLGIAFDPAFATNGFVYLYHTLCTQPSNGTCAGGASKNRVIRVHAVGNVTDGAAPVVILDGIDSDAGNHNAGWIDFGPVDHALYVATGDGGSDHTKSQNLGCLSGKVLRLETDGSIPTDNPYFGSPTARGEIWAAGLRNPWRCRFRNDGRLLCADVGQDTWEEVDVIFEANNYGWPTVEGPFTLAQFPTFTPPILWYGHNGADAAIMGGDFGAKTDFPGDYADSNALATALAASPMVAECLARQMFFSSSGRSSDAVATAEQTFVDTWTELPAADRGKFTEVLVAYVRSPLFAQRSPQ